jgi:hypothetical protein
MVKMPDNIVYDDNITKSNGESHNEEISLYVGLAGIVVCIGIIDLMFIAINTLAFQSSLLNSVILAVIGDVVALIISSCI